MGRYEDYNEMIYEIYCKTAISNAVSTARRKKVSEGQVFRSLSDFTDAELLPLSNSAEQEGYLPEIYMRFYAQGKEIQIKNLVLGQALTYLLPRDRDIILLYYFLGLRDGAIAKQLNISRATIQRRREAAVKKLKMILENIP